MQNMSAINQHNNYRTNTAAVRFKLDIMTRILRLVRPFPILMIIILMSIIVRLSSMMGYEWVNPAHSSGHGGGEAKKVEAPKEPETKIMHNPKEKELLAKGEKIDIKQTSNKKSSLNSKLYMGAKNSVGGAINVNGLNKKLYTFDPLSMKPEEVSLLFKLADAKSNTEKEDQALAEKKITLKALNKSLTQKIAILDNLKKEIEKALNKAQVVSESNIKGLVVMYEKMKPKDAARIFNGLNPQIVFLVMEKMNRGKSSMVLAKMDSDKARLITQKLALDRDVNRALNKKG